MVKIINTHYLLKTVLEQVILQSLIIWHIPTVGRCCPPYNVNL